MRLSLALTLFTAQLACSEPGVRTRPSLLEATPDEVDFGAVWVQTTGKATIALRTDLPDVRAVVLAPDPPFGFVGEPVRTVGAEPTEVVVLFTPSATGEFLGRLRLAIDGSSIEVALRGRGKAWPDCETLDTCQPRHFDPVKGACVEERTADGATCHAKCITSGVCEKGNCIGPRRSCDDGNPCTDDSCVFDEGCVHDDVTEHVCPADDPCLAPICDPVAGCSAVPRAEGGLCGAVSCESTPRCRSGRCVEEPTPDGAECPGSPCHDPGVCLAGMCSRPPGRLLEPAWIYETPFGKHPRFVGTTDDDGHLYWTECEDQLDGPCELVSLEARGVERWRVPLQGLERCWSRPRGLLISGDLVINGEQRNFVEARRTIDGALVWRRDLLHAVTNGFLADWMLDRRYTGAFIASLVDTGRDVIVVALRTTASCGGGTRYSGLDGSWLVAVETTSGRVLWVRETEDPVWAMLADREGELYAFLPDYRPPSGGTTELRGRLVAIDAMGQDRWSIEAAAAPRATADGILIAEDLAYGREAPESGLRLAALDGDLLSNFEAGSYDWWHSPEPVLSRDLMLFGHEAYGDPKLMAYRGDNLTAAHVLSRYPSYAGELSDLVLSGKGTVFAFLRRGATVSESCVSRYRTAVEFLSLADDGRSLSVCRTCTHTFPDALALTRGLLVTSGDGYAAPFAEEPQSRRIVAYRVGEKLAARGWVTRRGSPSGAGRPR